MNITDVEAKLWRQVRLYQEVLPEGVRSGWSAQRLSALAGGVYVPEGLYTSRCRCLLGVFIPADSDSLGGKMSHAFAMTELALTTQEALALESGFEAWPQRARNHGKSRDMTADELELYALGLAMARQLHAEELKRRGLVDPTPMPQMDRSEPAELF